MKNKSKKKSFTYLSTIIFSLWSCMLLVNHFSNSRKRKYHVLKVETE
ncbi:MAG: hypothetical protein GX913_04685 [Clostridiales bacterium]|nr:hypothetical protein [Clostridiales bacterium]